MSSPIQFGLTTFGDITIGANGQLLPQAQVIRNIIDEGVLAESAGIDIFSVGEHHNPNYAISAPEVALAAIAGRTSRVKLSSAATILGTDDPVRVFQRFSTLHALSNGRAEIILGRGWFTENFRIFGYNISDYDALFNEKLDLFASLLRQDQVTWNGNYRTALVNEQIFPQIEDGAMETWIAVGSTPESIIRAANYNCNMMLAIIGGEARRFVSFANLFRSAFEKLGKPPKHIGIHSSGYVADTDHVAREEFWAAYQPMRDTLGAARGWPPISRQQFDAEVDRGSLYVGSPSTVAQRISASVTEIGASRFDLKYSVGHLPHEKLCHSIDLFGHEVTPRARKILGQMTDLGGAHF